jgi:5-methyltetrahydrofolate--homocysteine methyltransferase
VKLLNNDLIEAMTELREKEALCIVNEMLLYENPVKILDYCRESLEIVGKRFEEGKYFLSHLIMASELFKDIMEILKPKISGYRDSEISGKIIIGTVEGDIHDLGKNIFKFLLEINDFHVLDLGVDVSPQKFVNKIRKFRPMIVGMSGLLTAAIGSTKKTIEAITEAGMRDDVKIIVGGSQMNDRVRIHVGADAYAPDAIKAVSMCRRIMDNGYNKTK